MLSKTYNAYGITSIIALSGFSLGLESSSLTAFLTSYQFYNFYGGLSSWEQSMIASSNAIGAVGKYIDLNYCTFIFVVDNNNLKVGCIICGALSELIGSIMSLQFACLLWIGGTAVAVFSTNIYMVVIARVLKGSSMGFISTILPVYVSETLPNNKKGTSLAIVQLSSTLGTLALYHTGNFFQTQVQNDLSFRYTWLVEMIPTLFLFLLSFFLPESPKWYASRSKWPDAARVLDRLKREDNTLDMGKRESLGDKGYVLSAYTSMPDVQSGSYADVFGKKYWKYTIIGITTQIFVQISGVSVLMYFFVYLCDVCGLDGDSKYWATSSQYFILTFFTIFPILLVDSSRRKDTLVFGFFLLGISYFTMNLLVLIFQISPSATFLLSNPPFKWEMREMPASAVLAIFLFLVSIYSSTISSVSWLYTGEIFPIAIRAKGSSICMCVSWMLNMCLTLLVPIVLPYIRFWIFGILSLYCLLAVFILSKFPETKDLDYSKLESLYIAGESALENGNHGDPKRSTKESEVSQNDSLHSHEFVSSKRHQPYSGSDPTINEEDIGDAVKDYLTVADRLVVKELKDKLIEFQSNKSSTISGSISQGGGINTSNQIKSKAIKGHTDYLQSDNIGSETSIDEKSQVSQAVFVDKEETEPRQLVSNNRSHSSDSNLLLYTSRPFNENEVSKSAVPTAALQSPISYETGSFYSNDWNPNIAKVADVQAGDANDKQVTTSVSPYISKSSSNASTSYTNNYQYEPVSFLRYGEQKSERKSGEFAGNSTFNIQKETLAKAFTIPNNARFGSNKNNMTTLAPTKDTNVPTKGGVEEPDRKSNWHLFGKGRRE